MLSGIKVADFSRALSGPLCGRILSDLGADVIKIESPFSDRVRHFPPTISNVSWLFTYANSGKKSLCIDFRNPLSREIICRLVKESDVVIENFRPKTSEKVGLTYENVRKVNPKTVMCSITGFGKNMEQSNLPWFGGTISAACGITYATKFFSKNNNPVSLPFAFPDALTAVFSSLAIVSCLYARTFTGQGQHIDMSMFDCSVFSFEPFAKFIFSNYEDEFPGVSPGILFQTKDGWFSTQPGFSAAKILTLVSREDILKENSSKQVDDYIETFISVVESWTKTKTLSEVEKLFRENDIPFCKVTSLKEVVSSGVLERREMLVDIEVGEHETKTLNTPFRFSSFKTGKASLGPPRRGQHSIEILLDVGFSNDEIDKFIEKGVVIQKHGK